MEASYSISYAERTYHMRGLHRQDIMCQRWQKHHRFYEQDLLEFIAKQQRRGVYIDAGANLGNHTVFFYNHCPATAVLAVEAHPCIYDVLNANAAANCVGDRGVAIFNISLGDTDVGWMALPTIDPHNVGSVRLQLHTTERLTRFAVPITTLDTLTTSVVTTDFWDTHGGCACLKVDCEGMDLAVLRGAKQLLANYRPIVAAEVETPEVEQQITALLQPLHYTCKFRTSKRPASHIWLPD